MFITQFIHNSSIANIYLKFSNVFYSTYKGRYNLDCEMADIIVLGL